MGYDSSRGREFKIEPEKINFEIGTQIRNFVHFYD